jgi:hypothetical protein
MSKLDRKLHGPGWAEVTLGALLSLLLGAVLAATVLVLRPVNTVRELPKPENRKRDAVYFIEGAKDMSKARQALAKRQAFIAGESVTITEGEVNALLAADAAAGTPTSAAEKKEPSSETVAVGMPNVRIRDDVVQVAAPVTLNAFGLSEKFVVQARGGFVREDDGFVYDPSEIYVGSCPVQRLPAINTYVRNKLLGATPIPEDLAAAWRKLSDVTVDGNVVRLSP